MSTQLSKHSQKKKTGSRRIWESWRLYSLASPLLKPDIPVMNFASGMMKIKQWSYNGFWFQIADINLRYNIFLKFNDQTARKSHQDSLKRQVTSVIKTHSENTISLILIFKIHNPIDARCISSDDYVLFLFSFVSVEWIWKESFDDGGEI